MVGRPILGVLLSLSISACTSSSDSPTAPEPTPITYAAIGASVTFGVGAVPLSKGYVGLIASRMEPVRSQVTLRNVSIPGARIEDILRLQLDAAVAAKPDVVTIWTGSNDLIHGATVEGFGAQLDTLLAELRAQLPATVFIGNLGDLTQAPTFRKDPDPDVTKQNINAFNARISASAQAHGAVLVPVNTLPITDAIFAIDGFHLNNRGHRELADIFWSQIAPTL